jgi:hypothetical protein
MTKITYLLEMLKHDHYSLCHNIIHIVFLKHHSDCDKLVSYSYNVHENWIKMAYVMLLR